MDKIFDRFVQASIKYGDAQTKGRIDVARVQNESLKKLRTHVRNHKEYKLEDFASLLDHENDYVKLKAAVSIIPVMPDVAEEVLNALSAKDAIISKEAVMLLELWKHRNA